MNGLILALIALFAYGLWGFGWKMVAKETSSIEWAVAIVFLCSAFISGIFALFKQNAMPNFNINFIFWGLIISLSGFFGNIFLVKALGTDIKTGVIMAISAAYPIITTILAYLFLKEHIGVSHLFGMIMILIGIAILSW